VKLTQGIIKNWPNWRHKTNSFKVVIALLLHILVVFAPATYRRLEFFLCIFTTYLVLQFGLVLGYHRLLSHRCFVTHAWLKRCLSLVGALAMQSGPISWVATHRLHHRIAEQEFDPHSPKHGLLWAHFFWIFFEHPRLSQSDKRTMIAHDLYADAFIRFCEEKFILLNAAVTAGIFLIGVGVGGLSRGFSFLVWIVAVRIVCLWHITFLTNSLGHTLGYRNFDTPDDSRNVWILGVLALGDGWHNNHHAFPACAAHGRRWFEMDFTYRLILVFERRGLAWNVRHPALTLNLSSQSQRYEPMKLILQCDGSDSGGGDDLQ
jgi:sn-2 palmitoyl-lipid 9-desaturase